MRSAMSPPPAADPPRTTGREPPAAELLDALQRQGHGLGLDLVTTSPTVVAGTGRSRITARTRGPAAVVRFRRRDETPAPRRAGEGQQ